ncbi:hypothetical protein L210DRAFT_2537794 [Boletus edulis BED1]|uniref:Uncharacterized protein n=1 Tax=Boletus edulis BED1 TaxID=1328754 RepID=A0AAD4G6J8_BOLED|nr:hypothetical protein L210DRAFT_2537794 [Boletus edulis BED1]
MTISYNEAQYPDPEVLMPELSLNSEGKLNVDNHATIDSGFGRRIYPSKPRHVSMQVGASESPSSLLGRPAVSLRQRWPRWVSVLMQVATTSSLRQRRRCFDSIIPVTSSLLRGRAEFADRLRHVE